MGKYIDVLSIHDLKYDKIAEEMNIKVDVEYWWVYAYNHLIEFFINPDYLYYNQQDLSSLFRYKNILFFNPNVNYIYL